MRIVKSVHNMKAMKRYMPDQRCVRRNLSLVLTISMVPAGGALAASTATNYAETCLLSYSPVATSSTSCPSHLIFKLGAEIAPKRLPKHEMVPIAVMIHGKVTTENATPPSALRKVIVDLDRNVTVDAVGFPVCKRSLLSRGGAERICRSSIIGEGKIHVMISQQKSIPLSLTIYNGGGNDRGTTTLFIRSAAAALSPTPLIGTVTVKNVHKGRYGSQAIAKIPRIAEGTGVLQDFSLKLKRLFTSKGTKRGYVSAQCPSGQLEGMITSALFKNENGIPGVPPATVLRGTVVSRCNQAG